MSDQNPVEIAQAMQDKICELEKNFPPELARGLKYLADMQCIVSASVPNAIPCEGEYPTKDAIRTYTLAMLVETCEFLQTLDWKAWKSKPQLVPHRVIDEFADILAFQGIIIYYLSLYGITAEDLAEGYIQKSIINMQRFLGQHGEEYKQPTLPEA